MDRNERLSQLYHNFQGLGGAADGMLVGDTFTTANYFGNYTLRQPDLYARMEGSAFSFLQSPQPEPGLVSTIPLPRA